MLLSTTAFRCMKNKGDGSSQGHCHPISQQCFFIGRKIGDGLFGQGKREAKGEIGMSKFKQWWKTEEDLMRQQGADDDAVLGAMRSIAEMAWDAAIESATLPVARAIEGAKNAEKLAPVTTRELEEGVVMGFLSLQLEAVLKAIKEMKNELHRHDNRT